MDPCSPDSRQPVTTTVRYKVKLPQLKEELAVRGSTRSGLKATLQRRLHGLLIEAAIALRDAAMAE